MSIEYIAEGYLNSKTNLSEFLKILKDEALKTAYPYASVHFFDVSDHECYFTIRGPECFDCWYAIQDPLLAKAPTEWLFMLFNDMDYCYEINGDLGKGKFTKNLFDSKASKQFMEIYEARIPAKIAKEKILNKKLTVKYL